MIQIRGFAWGVYHGFQAARRPPGEVAEACPAPRADRRRVAPLLYEYPWSTGGGAGVGSAVLLLTALLAACLQARRAARTVAMELSR
jgi:hypothetical protein